MGVIPFFYGAPLCGIALLFTDIPEIGPGFFPTLSWLLPVNLIAIILHFRAIHISPLSLTIPFLSFTPVIEGMKAENHPFKGILYAGLMIDPSGNPTVLEFNVRFGDPECQPLLMRLRSDLAEIFDAIVDGNLADTKVAWRASPSVCVVLAAGGYPESYKKGDKISGIEDTARLRDVMVFHAGTGLDQGELVTNGGRVLGVTALGESVKDAIDRAYEAVELISWDGMYYRKDIGHRALTREKAPQVAVVMGSASDWEIMKNAVDALRVMGVQSEVRVLSAHRTPEEATQYAQHAAARGIKVIIAGAGWAAHLAGAMAANSILPVIGVPVGSSPLNGMDALLSTVQMPPGIPVATVAIGGGGAKNAGLMAAQILALGDPELSRALKNERKRLANKVLQADENLANRAWPESPSSNSKWAAMPGKRWANAAQARRE